MTNIVLLVGNLGGMAPRDLLQQPRAGRCPACDEGHARVGPRAHPLHALTDAEGATRYGCGIIADDVQFLGRGRQEAGEETPQPELELEDELAS